MHMAQALKRRRLRAPRENGELLAAPSLAESGDLLRDNLAARDGADCELNGRSLASLIASARVDLLDAAMRYTRDYRDVPDVERGAAVLMAGHQPHLFHCGVWIKNFALDHLARRERCVAVNLIIDNDTVKSTSIRVPGGSPTAPTAAAISYDAPGAVVPLEDRPLADRGVFAGFASRVTDTIRPFVDDPLIERLWPLAVARAGATDNLGQCLAQGRHALEGELGLETLELPLSRACSTEAFSRLVCHVLAHLPRFWEIHNQSLREYRRLGRIRSTAHPVPDLSAEEDWLEAPFWVWRRDDPRRRRLFVRARGDEIVLTARGAIEFSLPLSADTSADRALERLAEIAASGVRLRPRALMTTMFARLLLSDLFIHGIGGAKYDELTDVLIGRFFGVVPPAFLTLSATLQLPIARDTVGRPDAQKIARLLRELTYQPERRLLADRSQTSADRGAIDRLIATKQRWIETPMTPDNAHERHLAICHVNQHLQQWVAARRVELLAEQEHVSHALAREHISSSREYAFCLFPQKTLPQLLLDMIRENL